MLIHKLDEGIKERKGISLGTASDGEPNEVLFTSYSIVQESGTSDIAINLEASHMLLHS